MEPCWQRNAARKARRGRRACVLANNGALPTTPASAPVMRSHRDGRWPLAPPSHDGLARAVAARPPVVRRRRRAAVKDASSRSSGFLRRFLLTIGGLSGGFAPPTAVYGEVIHRAGGLLERFNLSRYKFRKPRHRGSAKKQAHSLCVRDHEHVNTAGCFCFERSDLPEI